MGGRGSARRLVLPFPETATLEHSSRRIRLRVCAGACGFLIDVEIDEWVAVLRAPGPRRPSTFFQLVHAAPTATPDNRLRTAMSRRRRVAKPARTAQQKDRFSAKVRLGLRWMPDRRLCRVAEDRLPARGCLLCVRCGIRAARNGCPIGAAGGSCGTGTVRNGCRTGPAGGCRTGAAVKWIVRSGQVDRLVADVIHQPNTPERNQAR
jgi:hypothetical protein